MKPGPATVPQTRGLRPDSLDPLITLWRSMRDELEPILDRTQRDYAGSVAFWEGASGDRARHTTERTVSEGGRRIVTALDQGISAASTGITEISAARTAATAAIDTAEQALFIVSDFGEVTAPDAGLSLPPGADHDDYVAAQAALNDTAKTVHQPAIQTALSNLGIVVENTSVALEKAFEQIGGINEVAKTLPVELAGLDPSVQDILEGKSDPPTDPTEFHRWWTGLSDEDKDALYGIHHYIGNTDGMPAIDRDHYNRLTLEDELTRAQDAQKEVDDLLAAHPEWVNPLNPRIAGLDPEYVQWRAELDDAQNRAKHLDDLTTLAQVTDEEDYPQRLLMQVDSQSGEKVHAIVADGDPDSATHVTTYVPGTGSQPAKMVEDMERVDSMTKSAELAGADNPVTIAWFGYDSPPGIMDATQSEYAQEAAPALNAFQEGLRVTHVGGDSQNTVLGHSYGTTVIGTAASGDHTLDADNVVLVASPGAAVENVTEFNLTDVPDGEEGLHVFTTAAENDPVPAYSGAPEAGTVFLPPSRYFLDDHGVDPTSPDFGATVFESDPGSSTPVIGYNTDAHSQYWERGNQALKEMGEIIAGAE